MNDLKRNVEILCPLCGNDHFKCVTQELDNFVDAPDNIQFCCADCGAIYTKSELFYGNTEVIENTWQEMQTDVLNELKRRIAETWR